MKGTRLKSELLVAVWVISFLICAISFGVNSESIIINEHENTISASYQNPTLKVSVSVDKIKEGRPVDVTVVVKDAYGKPLPNATVGVYILKDSHLQPTDIPNGTTNAEGIVEFKGIVIRDVPEGTQIYFVAVYYWDYGYWAVTVEKVTFAEQLWENICIIVVIPVIILGVIITISGIVPFVRNKILMPGRMIFGISWLVISAFYLFSYLSGTFGRDKFLEPGIFLASLLLSGTCTMVLAITGVLWESSIGDSIDRFKKQKIWDNRIICGRYETSPDNPLLHVDGHHLFKVWKERLEVWKKKLASERTARYFIEGSKDVLASFKYIKENKYYGGASVGRKEVESFYDCKELQKLDVSYTLYNEMDIKKPDSPKEFKTEHKIFPYSQREIVCPRCKGLGRIECFSCSGKGSTVCSKCGGAGHFVTTFVIEREKEFGSGSSSSGVTHGPVGSWWTEERKIKHPSGVETKVNISHYASSGVPGYLRFETPKIKEKQLVTKETKCSACNGKGKIVCILCDGMGTIRCSDCDTRGKLRELSVKKWSCSDETQFNTEMPGPCGINIDEIKAISPVEVNLDEKSERDPAINKILRNLQERHEKWIKESIGTVLFTDYKAYVFPITECIVEYTDDTGKKTFSLWAIGTPKKWILVSPEIPLSLKPSKKFFRRRHIFFALTIISEIIIFAFLYKLLIFT
ncbi:MAG: hypothetical protein QW531_00040 [Thermoplasmata archaeon]